MKIKYVIAFAATLTVSASVAARPSKSTSPAQAAASDTVALSIVEDLTTEVGPRQGGTEAEARARAWSVKRLTDMGFKKVRIQSFDMPTWVRGEEAGEILSPFPQKLQLTALGNSGSTGSSGLTAEIAYFETLDDLKQAKEGSLKGKIAFVDHAMTPTQDGSSYGAFGLARFSGPQIAAEKGAAAIVIRSIGTDSHRNPHTGNTNFKDGTQPIPAAALSIPDADNLVRMINRTSKPLKMRLLLTPKNIGRQKSGNVIAEVPGSDPSLPWILVACHLDSWDLGTGAIDDAAGCGIVAAAAHHIQKNSKPKRGIRILWAGAEEVGIWGGASYSEVHAKDNHALAMESDFGADRVWKVEFRLPEGATELKNRIVRRLAPLGIARGVAEAGGGADVGPVIAAQKLGVIDLQQDGTRYFDLHHTPDDTFDKIDPAQLRQNVHAWTIVLEELTSYEGELSMGPAK